MVLVVAVVVVVVTVVVVSGRHPVHVALILCTWLLHPLPTAKYCAPAKKHRAHHSHPPHTTAHRV